MSSRTRIVVLHMKEIVYSLIFAAFAVVMLILLFIMFRSRQVDQGTADKATFSDAVYIPGVYSATVSLNDSSFDVQVRVDADHINSIELVNLSETIQTMYPLVESSLEDLSAQILDSQSTENLTCREDSRYTSALLLNAINSALAKAKA